MPEKSLCYILYALGIGENRVPILNDVLYIYIYKYFNEYGLPKNSFNNSNSLCV